MALRFMQVYLPDADSADVDSLLEDRQLLGTWKEADGDRVVLHVLASAEQSEPIMDGLEELLDGGRSLRCVLLPVEAVVPRPDEAAPADEAEQQANEVANAARLSREELYNEVVESSQIDRPYLAMTALSAVVAAGGLIQDDVAVIIGAMVIAPLLGPNVAMSLATTLGDLKLLRQSFVTNVVGLSLALAIAVAAGFLLSVDPEGDAIASRTQVGIADVILALAAGAAGAFAFTRGISGAVIGVMVAVALVPPLVVLGMMLGGGHWVAAWGAFLMVGMNVICINIAGVATFLAQGIWPRRWWEKERAQRATIIAITTWLILLGLLAALILLRQYWM